MTVTGHVTAGAVAPTEDVVADGLEAAKPFIRALCEAQMKIAEIRLSEKRAAKILAEAKAQREAEAQARAEAERRRWEAGES